MGGWGCTVSKHVHLCHLLDFRKRHKLSTQSSITLNKFKMLSFLICSPLKTIKKIVIITNAMKLTTCWNSR